MLATLGLGAGARADAAAAVTIKVMDLPRTYFVPVHGDPAYVQPYFVALASGGTDGDGADEVNLTGVKATFDLSSLQGKVSVDVRACTAHELVLTCDLGDFYQRTELTPFTLTALAGTPVGDAGPIGLTVTAGNAPTVSATTEVIVGRPKLTVGPDTSTELTAGTASVTPEFGNRGDLPVTQGITLSVYGQGNTTARYTNCRYDRTDRPTRAECAFDEPLAPGDAYRTDGAFAYTADSAPLGFDVSYGVAPTGDALPYTSLPANAPHGTVEPLRLIAIDGAGLVEHASSQHTFLPAGGVHVDYAAVGFTIKGKVGDSFRVRVPYPTTDNGAGLGLVKGPLKVTMPPGTRALVGFYQGEEAYCVPGRQGRTATCPFGPEPFGTYLQLRIDRKVPGASGTITVESAAGIDRNPANDTAVIKLVVTGGSGGSGSSAGGGSGATGSSGGAGGAGGATASGGTSSGASGTSGASGGATTGASGGAPGTLHGGLAATGETGLSLIAGGAVLALASGTALVVRRRTRAAG
ncbi:hypothetical protein [Streptomyces sp. NBC_01190]|uniref:hypothetical protein n=1 Tax=Streptomyces sp. NBC_01190 TaxID=2903767 RepID=UPI003869CD96|nr:hypothetical protein OG519_20275 [Streptomyces sp. NBC_01190]